MHSFMAIFGTNVQFYDHIWNEFTFFMTISVTNVLFMTISVTNVQFYDHIWNDCTDKKC